MVVDEELKMMCDICSEGGQILGPYLKPMTHLIHTEYILAGRTRRTSATYCVIDVRGDRHRQPGRERLPADQEVRDQGPRLLRRGDGAARPRRRRRRPPPTPRSCCVPPTCRVDGRLRVTAGATLVRDSDPAYEVAETHAKAGGILRAFGLVPGTGHLVG